MPADPELNIPLWSPEELASITSGTWLRPPGPEWNPVQVRGVCLPVTPKKHPPMMQAWLPASIMIVARERTLRNWFGKEQPPASPPTGCVVVGHALANSQALPKHRAVLVAPSCSDAMDALARRGRERIKRHLVAVTGTVGKTTTNRMLVDILSPHGAVRRNNGNNNMRTHVLQYMASVPAGTEFGVFEVGLGYDTERAFGELSAVIQPDLVLLTAVDLHHLGEFKGLGLNDDQLLKAIAERKLQLAEHLRPGGAVVLNAGIPFYRETRARLEREGRRVVSYGTEPGCDARLLRADAEGTATRILADVRGRRVEYRLPLPGAFMALNSLAAITTALECGVDPVEAGNTLENFAAVTGRANVLKLSIGGKDFTVIDDSFNATPLSMRMTFSLLQGFDVPDGGRRIAVVGDINHWGERSAALHSGLAADAKSHNIDKVFTAGIETVELQKALPAEMAGGHFFKKPALVEALVASLRSGDVVSVKASANQNFGSIVRMLRQAADRTER